MSKDQTCQEQSQGQAQCVVHQILLKLNANITVTVFSKCILYVRHCLTEKHLLNTLVSSFIFANTEDLEETSDNFSTTPVLHCFRDPQLPYNLDTIINSILQVKKKSSTSVKWRKEWPQRCHFHPCWVSVKGTELRGWVFTLAWAHMQWCRHSRR